MKVRSRVRIGFYCLGSLVGPLLAQCQAVTISDPTTTPTETWVVGNGQTVTFTHTSGWTRHKITIFNQANPSVEYSSTTIIPSTNPEYDNITVPDTGTASQVYTSAAVKVECFNAMNTSLGSDTVNVSIYKP